MTAAWTSWRHFGAPLRRIGAYSYSAYVFHKPLHVVRIHVVAAHPYRIGDFKTLFLINVPLGDHQVAGANFRDDRVIGHIEAGRHQRP